MTRWLYGLRVVDSATLGLAASTAALTLARDEGLTAYSRFTSVVMIGTVVGGIGTFLVLNTVRSNAIAWAGSIVSGLARVVLPAAALGWIGGGLAVAVVAGVMVAIGSVVITSMFHSLSSDGQGGVRARTRLLAATALGALLGTLGAGTALEAGWGRAVVLIELAGAFNGLVVASRYAHRFYGPSPGAIGIATAWRRILPITWRVPLIASLSFSMGSLAPGVLTDLRGPAAGGVAGATYLLGALGSSLVVQLGTLGPAVATGRWMRDHRQWFLPATIGSLLWTLVTGPLAVSLVAILLAGVILHLVQAAFEQATAELNEPRYAGPSIVALHGIAGVASAISVAVLPQLIEAIGYVETVGVTSGALLLLAVADLARGPAVPRSV